MEKRNRLLDHFLRFFLVHKIVAVLMLAAVVGGGLMTAPFAWPTFLRAGGWDCMVSAPLPTSSSR